MAIISKSGDKMIAKYVKKSTALAPWIFKLLF